MTNKQREQINTQKMEELASILSEYGIEVKNYDRCSYYLNIPTDIQYKAHYIPAKNGRKGVSMFYVHDWSGEGEPTPTYSLKVGNFGTTYNSHQRKSYIKSGYPGFFDLIKEEYVMDNSGLPEDTDISSPYFHTLEETIAYLVKNFGN
jgi:hypothetical protein